MGLVLNIILNPHKNSKYKDLKLLEFVIIGFLGILLILVFLIFQKMNSKNDLGVERTVNKQLGDLNSKLQTITDTKQKIEDLQKDMLDFNNLFNNKTERGKFGEEYLEDIVKDSINKNERILVIDDLIATGGTAEAAAKLIEISGGKVAGFIFVINLFDLPGNDLLKRKSYFTESLIEFPGH